VNPLFLIGNDVEKSSGEETDNISCGFFIIGRRSSGFKRSGGGYGSGSGRTGGAFECKCGVVAITVSAFRRISGFAGRGVMWATATATGRLARRTVDGGVLVFETLAALYGTGGRRVGRFGSVVVVIHVKTLGKKMVKSFLVFSEYSD
jgi:hypothetical protein